MKTFDKILRDYELHCQQIEQSTDIRIGEKPSEKLQRIKKLELDYVSWFEYYFPMYARVKCADFHKEFSQIIINNPISDTLLEIYRSGAKSVHADMGIPLYLYLTKQLYFCLLIGHTLDKAKKLISDIQSQLQYNQRLINDYGKRYKYGDWAEGDFSTIDRAKFVARGFRQSVRGLREQSQRPDYIVVDDVDSIELCNNERRSRKAYEWIWEDLKGTFDEGSPRKRFIVANNNFHKNTLINKLKEEFSLINEKAEENKTPLKHFIVTVKAVKDLKTFEPTWKAKTTSEYWKQKFEETPYRSFMREYMHTHIQDGTIFKPEQIQFKDCLNLDSYDALCFYGDLSYKEQGDFKALILVGKSGREFHVINAFIRQTSRANVAKWLYDYVADSKLLNHNIKYKIEGLFAQDDFVNDFDLEGDQRGWYIPVTADRKPKENKFDRIESMAGYFERGNIWLNSHFKGGRDFQNLEDQLLAFEKGSGANDDAPDALQSAIAEVNKISFTTKFEPKTISRKTILNNKYNRF